MIAIIDQRNQCIVDNKADVEVDFAIRD